MPTWLDFLNRIRWTPDALTRVEENTAAGMYNDMTNEIAPEDLVDHVKMWHEATVDTWASQNMRRAKKATI